jgi:hypothetical protein
MGFSLRHNRNIFNTSGNKKGNIMKKITLFISLFLFCLGVGQSYGLERFQLVTTEEMAEMLEQREAGKMDFLLLNALDEMIFRYSSIPGSINIPLDRIETMISTLGNDKERLIVSYCMGYR